MSRKFKGMTQYKFRLTWALGTYDRGFVVDSIGFSNIKEPL